MLIYVDLKEVTSPTHIADTISKIITEAPTGESIQVIGLATSNTPATINQWMRYTKGYQVLLHPDEDAGFRGKSITMDLCLQLSNASGHSVAWLLTNDNSYSVLTPLAAAHNVQLKLAGISA